MKEANQKVCLFFVAHLGNNLAGCDRSIDGAGGSNIGETCDTNPLPNSEFNFWVIAPFEGATGCWYLE